MITINSKNENISMEDMMSEVDKLSDLVRIGNTVSINNEDTIVVLQASQGPVRFTVDEYR